ncbi:MAG: 16S rRNA (cytidine(1402)-2'-O)-methyltransferase [Candidatus Omnitrophica bacterium]|nr:16S rRNA (cytidine(1402)-2'-O)-methyltransferase [Candidatus Omnitrophota bacterium]
MLYIVSTPIGNLKDISLRALEVLKEVDLIACEDTRHTQKLLTHYQISKPLISYFEHNEEKRSQELLAQLKNGKKIALVSDAGTPGVSDPGYRLIKASRDNDIPITVIPGACAVIAALSLSGLPSNAFIFEGFLPVKAGGRRNKLLEFKNERRTVIFYESTHRILKTLFDIQEVLDDPQIVCCREITKAFEEVKRGKASEVLAHFQTHPLKGEFVIVI